MSQTRTGPHFSTLTFSVTEVMDRPASLLILAAAPMGCHGALVRAGVVRTNPLRVRATLWRSAHEGGPRTAPKPPRAMLAIDSRTLKGRHRAAHDHDHPRACDGPRLPPAQQPGAATVGRAELRRRARLLPRGDLGALHCRGPVEVDPVGLVRGHRGPKGGEASLGEYVNTAPTLRRRTSRRRSPLAAGDVGSVQGASSARRGAHRSRGTAARRPGSR